MTDEKHIALICRLGQDNAKAIRLADEIAMQLKIRKIAFSLFNTAWPTQFELFTDVWIVGGDGTLNQFINQNPELQLPLSIFSAGSGNDFHWALYGEMSWLQQLDLVLQQRKRWIDGGKCNGHLFINGVGIGFDGAIVKELIGKRKVAGKASYLLAILKNILRYNETKCSITIDKDTLTQECFMISVANGKRYGGGFCVAPKAVLTDALLDVNIVGEIAPLQRMRYLPFIEKGEHIGLPFVQYYQSGKILIKTPFTLPAHMDGEYFSASTFDIEVLPKKFLFCV